MLLLGYGQRTLGFHSLEGPAMRTLFILPFIPTLIALAFGQWTPPVFAIPALSFVGFWWVLRLTPSAFVLGRTRFPAPTWATATRGLALLLFLGSLIWATLIGLGVA